MSRMWLIMITGLMFLVYLPIGMMAPRALAVEDVDLVVTSTQQPAVAEQTKNRKVSARDHIREIKRGQFVKTEALVSNRGPGRSGPFEVGIYLSHYPDGRDKAHEFDVIKNVDLSSSEQIVISGEYLIPYSISVARDYWVVMEADYDGEVTEKDENNRKIIKTINVPCDEFALGYDNDPYLCPRFGEND